MSFIGIFTSSKDFNLIKTKILEHINGNHVNIMKISKQNIDNIKNVKFETIVICNAIEPLEEHLKCLENMIKNSKYLILNSDIRFDFSFENQEMLNIITYGLNQKATMTISSNEEDSILIALQREIVNIYGKALEVEEIQVNLVKYGNLKVEDILIIYIILLIYSKK